MKKVILSACIIFLIHSSEAFALSKVCSNKDPAEAYSNADAVVAATVESITASSPDFPKHDIVRIAVQKYWKLKDETLPTEVHVKSKEIRQAGYLMFLKYDENQHGYLLELCAPLIEIQQDGPLNLDQLYYLKTQPIQDVEE